MAISSQELFDVVFERTFGSGTGEVSMAPIMLQFLVEVDGKNTVGAIVQKLGIRMVDARQILAKLIKLGLIKQKKKARSILNVEIVRFLNRRLAMILGPFSSILIEDTMSEMGYGIDSFPSHRAAELIEQLARDIKDDVQRAEFVRDMLAKINPM